MVHFVMGCILCAGTVRYVPLHIQYFVKVHFVSVIILSVMGKIYMIFPCTQFCDGDGKLYM